MLTKPFVVNLNQPRGEFFIPQVIKSKKLIVKLIYSEENHDRKVPAGDHPSPRRFETVP